MFTFPGLPNFPGSITDSGQVVKHLEQIHRTLVAVMSGEVEGAKFPGKAPPTPVAVSALLEDHRVMAATDGEGLLEHLLPEVLSVVAGAHAFDIATQDLKFG